MTNHSQISPFLRMVEIIISFISVWVIIPMSSCGQTTSNQLVPTIRFIPSGNSGKLEAVDWGGSGKAIMFLSGLGATAHIYQNFAPLFIKNFHVYGMTRRGFGASFQSGPAYHVKTLAKDIVTVVDSLHLEKVILIGHSFAGAELTEFATVYPNRVDKIIYLDAAYDWIEMTSIFSEYPSFPPSKQDYASLSQNRKYLARITGVIFPEEEMRASYIYDQKGTYVGNVSPDSISFNILKAIKTPNYLNIKAPILAIYIDVKSPNELFGSYPKFTKSNRVKATLYYKQHAVFAEKGMKELIRQQPNANIKLIRKGNHYVFISNPKETFTLIEDFLST